MPVTISGSTGVGTPGLTSETMPMSDGAPIVESGSNSDGTWTRWADGTQRSSNKILVEGSRAITFSTPFQASTTPDVEVTAVRTGAARIATIGETGLSSSQVTLYLWNVLDSPQNAVVHYSANGHWK